MPFDFYKPASLSEAIEMLRAGGDEARPISGGQSLMPMVNLGLAAPSSLVDLSGLAELHGIYVGDEAILIGAATRHRDLIASPEVNRHAPLLVAAAGKIGSPRIRNMGTIGGSLAHGDPAAELPLACLCLEARYELLGPEGARWCSATDFAMGYYTTDLREAEVLTKVSIQRTQGAGWGFEEYARRSGDFALAAAAVVVAVADGILTSARVAVTGAEDRPVRLTELEDELVGQPAERAHSAARLAESLVTPSPDPYVEPAYRRRLIGALTKRALIQAVERCEEKAA